MSKPMFAKRHYEAIAQAIQNAAPLQNDADEGTRWQLERVIDALAQTFSRDNGGFKPDRFKRACVPGANVRARS